MNRLADGYQLTPVRRAADPASRPCRRSATASNGNDAEAKCTKNAHNTRRYVAPAPQGPASVGAAEFHDVHAGDEAIAERIDVKDSSFTDDRAVE